MSSFAASTALERGRDGGFEGVLDERWAIGRGLHGGYVAATMLRALIDTLEDAPRQPRSFTTHFTRPAMPGPVEVLTAVERSGRSLSTLTGRMLQDGKLVALSLAAFADPREGIAFSDLPLPDVAAPEEISGFVRDFGRPTFTDNFDYRPAQGALPFSGAADSRTGGWIRLLEPQVADAPFVVALTDAWIPAVLSRLTQPAGAVPTIDLTVHFRAELPLPGAQPDDFHYIEFVSRLAEHGFWEEDGVVWTRDGQVLAQSRQLALLG